jgi:hypothetical protein
VEIGERFEIVDAEYRKLEKSILELTDAVKQLTVSLNAAKSSNGHHHSPLNNFHISEGPKPICRNVNCGVIQSDSTLCDHTLQRYQSEYDCG